MLRFRSLGGKESFPSDMLVPALKPIRIRIEAFPIEAKPGFNPVLFENVDRFLAGPVAYEPKFLCVSRSGEF